MSDALTFYGATGTVTGSKTLVELAGRRILVDCGLYQGFKQLRLRNWRPLPFEARSLDAVIITHAHVDHIGALPLLLRDGYAGPIHATPATIELARIVLPDAARLQEADAEYANRRGFSKHSPALPLYTEDDARRCLERLRPLEWDQPLAVGPVHIEARRAGHILGAASLALTAAGRTVGFSGDLGRPDDAMMRAPAPGFACDALVIESTYGGRRHGALSPEDELAAAVGPALGRGGTVILPAFAVGRTQLLVLLLERLRRAGRIADVPIWIDSPMATSVTELYWTHRETHRLDRGECRALDGAVAFADTPAKSRALDTDDTPKLIVSASGMATGGRVIHHIKRYAPEPQHAIVFAGFQAAGTRGARMCSGESTVRIHGEDVPVRAEVRRLDSLSAHADHDELLAWCRTFPRAPAVTCIQHGEPAAADALRSALERELGWTCEVPDYRDRVALPLP